MLKKTLVLCTLMIGCNSGAVEDQPGKIVQFGGRAGAAQGSAPAVQDLFEELFQTRDLPPYALRFIHELDQRSNQQAAANDLARYVTALRFLAKPGGEIPGLALEHAHARATQMQWRRPTAPDLDFEIGEIKQYFAINRTVGQDPIEARDEAFDSAEMAEQDGGTPPVPRRADPLEDKLRTAREALDGLRTEFGWSTSPKFWDAFARELAGAYWYTEEVLENFDVYATALRFGLSTPDGPGLSPEAAHARAVRLPAANRNIYVQHKVAETYHAIFGRLSAPLGQGGFGLAEDAARAEALTMADHLELPTPHFAREVLNRRQTLPGFFTRPVREGGLGLPQDQAVAAIAAFNKKYIPTISSERLIETYRHAVPRILARDQARGEADEARARDEAMAMLDKNVSPSLLMIRMDNEGFPKVTPPPRPGQSTSQSDGGSCAPTMLGEDKRT